MQKLWSIKVQTAKTVKNPAIRTNSDPDQQKSGQIRLGCRMTFFFTNLDTNQTYHDGGGGGGYVDGGGDGYMGGGGRLVDGGDDGRDACRAAAARQICKELETLKELDATTSTRHHDADTHSTMQKPKRKDAKARIVSGKRSNPNIFGFFVD